MFWMLFVHVSGGLVVWFGVGCPCPPVRNDIVTPRHLLKIKKILKENGNFEKKEMGILKKSNGNFEKRTRNLEMINMGRKCNRNPTKF